MGILKLRDLNQIHNLKLSLSGSAGETVSTFARHIPFEFKGLIDKNHYIQYGCCTSYSPRCNSASVKYENSFIGLETKYFPSSYKNMELVTKWVDFINGLFPFFDIKIITDFQQNIINPEYWEEKGLSFTFNKNKIYFVIKKDITKNQYFNLFQLSLLRYFVANEYYFMIHDCLKLREKKSFKKLSNWDIMNIARFGVQTNSQQFSKKIEYGVYEYAFLRDYRSPIYNMCYTYTLNSEERVIELLEEGCQQNNSCRKNYLLIDVIYLMKLYQLGHYNKLYKLLTNCEKYETPNSSNVSKFIATQYNNLTQFNDLNNRKNFNYKEYEKTL